MTFPPETEAAAKAMYEAGKPNNAPSWHNLYPDEQDGYCQAFVAGLRTLVPVTSRMVDAMIQSDRPHKPTIGQARKADAIALINYLSGTAK